MITVCQYSSINIILFKVNLMRKKEFLNKLMKISQLNQLLTPLNDFPLFSCKPSKIGGRQLRKDQPLHMAVEKQIEAIHTDILSIKKKEVVVLHVNRPESAKKRISLHKPNTFNQRFKTAPSVDLQPQPNSERNIYEKSIKGPQTEKQFDGKKLSKFSLQTRQIDYLKTRQILPIRFNQRNNLGFFKKEQRPKHLMLEKRFSQQINKKSKRQSSQINQIKTFESNISFKRNDSLKTQSFGRHQSYQDSLNKNQVSNQINFDKMSKIAMRRQIYKNYNKQFNPPPKISAKSCIIFETKINMQNFSKVIYTLNSKSTQQIASLTKIMTCILTIELCKQYGVDKFVEQVTIGRFESNIGGTTAKLRKGQIYTIQQLIYGLMLPSGNDASVALAVWAGGKIIENTLKDQIFGKRISKTEKYNKFIEQMNQKAKQIKMTKTNYANSHGLVNHNNKSCAYDVALLCEYAMKDEYFRQVVKTKHYQCAIKHQKHVPSVKMVEENAQERQAQWQCSQNNQQTEQTSKCTASTYRESESSQIWKDTASWQNTHKLVQMKSKEYLGIKTGFTTAAGPCLSSMIQIQDRHFIIVVLGCGKMSLRFKQTQILKRWLYKHENIKRTKSKNQSRLKQSQIVNEQQQAEQAELSQLNDERQIQD